MQQSARSCCCTCKTLRFAAVYFLVSTPANRMILPPEKSARSKKVPTRKGTKNFSQVTRSIIAALAEAHVEFDQIIKQTGASRATVFRILRALKKNELKTKKVGRQSKTTPEMDKFIIDSSESNRKLLPKELQKLLLEKYGVFLSLTRIRFRLRMAGLFGHVCSRKPLLSTLNKLKRLLWAFQHRKWTVTQWKKILWSDEKKIELFNSKRRTYCRRMKNEPLRSDTIQGTVKHGGGSVMFWGCFGGVGMGDIHQITGIMKKEEYHQILIKHAMPSGSRLFGSGWTFQQDNHPKHKSRLCNEYLQKKADAGVIELMTWPPQSPDLSPIELLWDEVDRQVQSKKPTSIAELTSIVKDTWKEIAEDVLEKLLARMPLLCQAVIDAEGGYFNEKLAPQKKKQMVYH